MDQEVDKTRSVTTSGKQRAVPKGRVQRFGKFARLAGGVAGNPVKLHDELLHALAILRTELRELYIGL